MKIKKLIVKNYKVFDHLELDFTDKNGDVLDTVVLAGLNGSGKTTVLELLTDLINGDAPQYLKKDTEIKLEILFVKMNSIFDYEQRNKILGSYNVKFSSYSNEFDILTFDHKGIHGFSNLVTSFKNIGTGNQNPFLANTKKLNIEAMYFYANDMQLKNKNRSQNVIKITFTANNVEIRENILEIIRKEVFNNLDQSPRSIFAQQISNLNKIFKNLDVKSKLIEVSDKDLIFESTNGQKIGFDDLSSGEKTLYFMGFTLNQLNPQDALIMIDEPEDSLHPKWQQQIVRFFNNIGSDNQIILATHSPQIIASVHPESLFVLAINDETHRVEAINMADEHKYSYGVDPNRILSEIMGTPIRDYETQLKINTLSDKIKHAEFDPLVPDISAVEKEVDALAEDFGKQDATVMRFRNELRLLKRKMVAV